MRRLLILTVALVAAAAVVTASAGIMLYARADMMNVGKLTFANELKIPPLLAPGERTDARSSTESSAVNNEYGWRLGRIIDPFGREWTIGAPLGAWPPN
jgi:hypothetical protein